MEAAVIYFPPLDLNLSGPSEQMPSLAVADCHPGMYIYIGKYPSPRGRQEYRPMSFGGKDDNRKGKIYVQNEKIKCKRGRLKPKRAQEE
jgi:hypothetical protein